MCDPHAISPSASPKHPPIIEGSFGVLDIECSKDPALDLRATRSTSAKLLGLKLDGFCLLSGRFEGQESKGLTLLSRFSDDEPALLRALSEAMADKCAEGTIITFNGSAYDLPIIRRRAIRHLLFDLFGLHNLTNVRHIDLLTEMGNGSQKACGSLSDRCAVYSIDCDPYHVAQRPERMTRAERKCQIDVAATFMLLLHELSSVHETPDILASGWDALEHMLAGKKGGGDHLMQFLP